MKSSLIGTFLSLICPFLGSILKLYVSDLSTNISIPCGISPSEMFACANASLAIASTSLLATSEIDSVEICFSPGAHLVCHLELSYLTVGSNIKTIYFTSSTDHSNKTILTCDPSMPTLSLLFLITDISDLDIVFSGLEFQISGIVNEDRGLIHISESVLSTSRTMDNCYSINVAPFYQFWDKMYFNHLSFNI